MTKMKYSFMTYANKDGSREWCKTPQFQKKASVEYLYIVVKDAAYPHGRVLLTCHAPEDEHDRHENLLNRHKFILDYHIKTEEQRQKKRAEGYTLLNLQKDVIEVGAVRYDGEGNRYDFSRTRFHDQENAHARRRTIDLVYARIKKHMNQVVDREMKAMETRKAADEKLALIYAPLGVDNQERRAFIVPKDRGFEDFMKENNMIPYRVFSIARVKNNQPVVSEMVTFEPYIGLASQNRDIILKAIPSSPILAPQILNRLLRSGR